MRINSLAVRTQDERYREIGELFKRTKNNEESQGGKRTVSQVQKNASVKAYMHRIKIGYLKGAQMKYQLYEI